MPVYEYICKDCGHHFDAMRRMSEADQPIACTACQHINAKRQLSVFYARSDGRSVTSSGGGCGNCGGGGSCGNCNHSHN
jgi:putative FmdB family regulatory protein